MKAVVINHYGNSDVLEDTEITKPTPEPNQVLVEVFATSINPIDWKVREGYMKEVIPFEFPIILGWDVAGKIVAVGDKVKNYQVGDEVFARPANTNKGTYAEYTLVDEDLLAKKPTTITFEEAASIPLAGLTAWQSLLDVAKLQEGEKVLIQAGAGGVGSLAIQIAKHVGAYVATTASKENEDYVKALGADLFINYKTEDFENIVKDFDVVFDMMGGEILDRGITVLKPGGRIVTIAGQPNQALADQYQVKAYSYWLEPNGKQLQEMADLLDKEIIKPQVNHTFSFSASGIKEAHDLSATHHAKGKIVIKMK
ncbi:NADP-dependent oxidoreductase [Paraliobacillus salinarum]|uniref:NADP-dependent oxidoreductase n=1 Tax=Paraliobacillus salinarum TaxID=1158996 RepID=UPI0015F3DCAD|nr:NADP-dependent oxidoreductase [Paraliobacillus salinarum]